MSSALRPLQLRSSSVHCVQKLANSLAKSWQAEVNMEVEAEVVEKEDEEEVEEKEKEKEKNNSDKI